MVRKSNKINRLPVFDCPCCDGFLHVMEVTVACEKCTNIYPVTIDAVAEHFDLQHVDTEKIRRFLQLLHKNSVFIKKEKSKRAKEKLQNENRLTRFTTILDGTYLKAIQKIKQGFAMSSLLETIKLAIRFMVVLYTARMRLEGDKIFFCDEHGNRSDDIKPALIENIKDVFAETQNREIVESFMKEMGIKIKTEKLKASNVSN